MSKKILLSLVNLVIILVSVLGIEPVQAETIFDDVSADHWAYESIMRLYDAGVTTGCSLSPLKYCPEEYVTRAEIAIFLERGMNYQEKNYEPPSASGNVFKDVPSTAFAADWIEQLAADGITLGCGEGNYCPSDPVTRAQIAYFLLRAKYGANYSPPEVENSTGFNDVETNDFGAAWIKQLAAAGITSGCGDGNYCPNNPVTRAEMAKFLVSTFYLPELVSIPMATVYIQNDTGGELCYEVYDTGIGMQCYEAGEHLYGSFPSGTYDYYVSARCGSVIDNYEIDGGIIHKFWCKVMP